MNIIFARHGTSKEYVFSVPDSMASRIKQGDILWVNTMRGEQVAVATTGVVSGEGARDVALRNGAYEPLKSVISYANAEMQKWIVKDVLAKTINDVDNEGLPF